MKARSGARVDTYLHASTRPGFNAYATTGGFGNMLFHHHTGNGFDIWYSSYTFTRADHFTNRVNIPVLELHFPLTGSYHSQWNGFYNSTFEEKQFDLSYAPFIHQQSTVHAGLSETKLQICFKQLFETTIFDYHQSLHLDHARFLLKTTPYTIQHIAFECGYNDHANLTAAFKKRFGCTPDFYRKNG